MGLDMYLTGEKFCRTNWKDESKNRKEEGYRIRQIDLDLGYWCKHPNLHGFIVENFADGQDNCEKINLSVDNMKQIISAVENDSLIPTEGFFFGKSSDRHSEDPEEAKWGQQEYDETIKHFKNAIEFVETVDDEDADQQYWRDVYYQASW